MINATMGDCSLYLVTSTTKVDVASMLQIVKKAVDAGVSVVQVREKDRSRADIVSIARAVREVLQGCDVRVLLNDLPDLVVESGLDGVHIGISDFDVEEARLLVGQDAILGVTIDNLHLDLQRMESVVDYYGVGPVFHTDNKNTVKPIGLAGLRQIRSQTANPIIAIGGINIDNMADVLQCGVDGVAFINAVFNASDPYMQVQNMKRVVRKCQIKP